MRRRYFITLLGGGAAFALSRASYAQRGERMRRVGVLMPVPESDRRYHSFVAAFKEGLQNFGWTEDRNVRIDIRWAPNVDSMLRSAQELIALQPDLILSLSTPATAALLHRSRTVPIVFVQVTDPIGSGFVSSYPRPGGNVTGFTNIEPTMAGKWLELLKEVAPRVKRVAILFNPTTATYSEHLVKPFKAAAASFAVEASTAPARDKSELESAVAVHAREPNSGLVVMPDPFTSAHRSEITALADRYRLPTVYPFRFYPELGGLLSYGNDIADNFQRAAAYVDRILKGEKPGELPVQFPVKFELVINLKTAKALGLDVPLHLQQRADELIE